MRVVAVVLAGGASSRFGSDKLAARVDQQALLDHTLATLPEEFATVVVGPERSTARPVMFTREQPAGGGPAAAMAAGVRAALPLTPEIIVVLPGDTPAAGHGALTLVAALGEHEAAIGVDAVGQLQPLQLALTPPAAHRLVALAGPDGAAGRSARRLVAGLDPIGVRLPPVQAFDVDTPDQLLLWLLHTGSAVSAAVEAIATRRDAARPVVVAVDGPSGAGKSALAAALALRTGGTVIEGDDFYNPVLPGLSAAAPTRMSDAEIAGVVIDWRRLRSEALEPLREGRDAVYRAFDWSAEDSRLAAEPRRLVAGDPVIVEGVYSARPELADLIDLTVFVETNPGVRTSRLADRGDRGDWAAFWRRGEQHYFRCVRPPATFDLRLDPHP